MNELDIFTAAVELTDPAARARFLDEACGSHPEQRNRIEALLRSAAEASRFLESPAPGIEAAPTIEPTITQRVGTQIGPYKLLQQIGEGGMGTVFMAEQKEPVQRKVALKVIKAGMDSRQVIARFEAERQALAMMDHVNIARVLDAGTTPEGRPYFVMELVQGVPITTYCDDNHLTLRQRLELFVPVCHAIQHAHQKGIIHRDIKPSNVMVTLYDGRPVPKVIDFGVAKATEQKLTERTLFTQFGAMIGTLEYMSPEQAELSALGVDTRSDIYSLGVLLYELLTGSTPLSGKRMKDAAYAEILRLIKEEEPPRPSTRLSESGEALASISAQRKIEPAQLTKLVRGELDWIVMKTLEKDRNRRYETANGLAQDVHRYLNDETVEACPPSVGYRFTKFARHNRLVIVATTLVATALVLGTVVSAWQANRAEAARTAEAEQRGLAEDQRNEAEKQRRQSEANFQKARNAVDEYFTLVSESKLLDVPGLQPLRKELLEAALRFYETTAKERVNDPDVMADVAVTYLRVGQIDHAINRNDEAIDAIGKALIVIDRLRRDYPASKEKQRRLAGFWKGYRPAQMRTNMPKDPRGALRTLQRSIDTWQELADEHPTQLAFQSDLASLCYLTGLMLSGSDEPASVRYYERSRAILEKLILSEPTSLEHRADLARTCQDLVGKLARAGRKAEADAAQKRSLALREELVDRLPSSPQYRVELATILGQRAGAIAKQQPDEAEKMFERAFDLGRGLVREFPDQGLNYELLATTSRGWGRYALASGKMQPRERYLKMVQDVETWNVDGPKGSHVAVILVTSYHEIAKSQSGDERLHTIRKAIAVCRRVLDATATLRESPVTLPGSDAALGIFGLYFNDMAELLAKSGQSDEAVETAVQFMEMAEKRARARTDGFTAFAHTCRWLSATRGHEEEYLRKAIAAFEHMQAHEHITSENRAFFADTLISLGRRLEARSDPAEAETCYRRATALNIDLAMEYPDNGKHPTDAAQCTIKLVRLLRAQSKLDEAAETMRNEGPKLGDGWQLRLYRGLVHRELGELDEAIADFTWGVARAPKVTEFWTLRASCYSRQGDYPRAAEDYSQAIRLQAKDNDVWSGRAWAYFHLHQWDRAADDFSKAIERNSNVHSHWFHRGHAYLKLAQWDKAEADFTRVVETWPDGADGWYLRGLARAQLNQPEKALADLRQAIAKGFKSAKSLRNDRRFAPLSANDEFKQLMNDLEK